MKPLLVIITGRPGVGKTTLGHKLANDLQLSIICKDEVKEILFDSLGYSDKEWSRKLGMSAYRIIDYAIKNHLSTGNGLIIESNFLNKFDSERISGIIEAFDAECMQIILHCDEEIRSKRYIDRNASGERHPGHHILDVLQENLTDEKYEALSIDCPLIELDTTHFANIDYDSLVERIRQRK